MGDKFLEQGINFKFYVELEKLVAKLEEYKDWYSWVMWKLTKSWLGEESIDMAKGLILTCILHSSDFHISVYLHRT